MAENANYGLKGVGSPLELGKGGPKLKNVSGVVEVKNNADDAYANIKSTTPTAAGQVVVVDASIKIPETLIPEGVQGFALVYEKAVASDVAYVEITGLDGDADQEYLLVMKIVSIISSPLE